MSDTDIPVDEAIDPGFAPPEMPDRIRVDDEEPPIGDEDVADAPDMADENPITELTPEERQQFRNFLTIGKRTKTIHIFDHPIVIASLNCDDEIRVGTVTKEHRDSTGFARAYQCAVAASAIKSVDGRSWEQSLADEPDPDVIFRKKHDKVLGMNPLVVGRVYEEVVQMESEFADLAAKLGKR